MSERCSELVSKDKVEACCCQCCGLTYYLQQNLADFNSDSVLQTLWGFMKPTIQERKKNFYNPLLVFLSFK